MSNAERTFLDDLVEDVESELTNAKQGKTSGLELTHATDQQSLTPGHSKKQTPSRTATRLPKSLRSSRNHQHAAAIVPSTHLKARVQKSIRFLPQLIVAVDEYLRSQAPGDDQTLQKIMNEALADWLQKNTS